MSIDAFLQTLPVGFYGLGGIFVVMAVVYFSIKFLTKVFADEQIDYKSMIVKGETTNDKDRSKKVYQRRES